MKRNKSLPLYLILSFLCLVLGAASYFLPPEFKLFRNYAADFLWLLSFEFALAPFFKELFPKRYAAALFSVCTAAGALFELLQRLGVFGGTGDIFDVIVYLAAGTLGLLIIKSITKKEK